MRLQMFACIYASCLEKCKNTLNKLAFRLKYYHSLWECFAWDLKAHVIFFCFIKLVSLRKLVLWRSVSANHSLYRGPLYWHGLCPICLSVAMFSISLPKHELILIIAFFAVGLKPTFVRRNLCRPVYFSFAQWMCEHLLPRCRNKICFPSVTVGYWAKPCYKAFNCW